MASATISHVVIRVPRSYDEVFVASLAATQDAEFTVTSQERQHGALVAEKRLPRAEGEPLQMTVCIPRRPGGIKMALAGVSEGEDTVHTRDPALA